MMKIYKKIISITLVFVLIFTGLPNQLINFNEISNAYADEITSAIDISYDNFANTENLQLNGDSLIVNNAIQFESKGAAGESAFTKEKVTLGVNSSFSTAFSFRNISPSYPSVGKEGGFTFTLQAVEDTVTTSNFQDENISPSLSIAFDINYVTSKLTSSLTEPLLLASLAGFRVAQEPPIRCEISATSYINGDYGGWISRQNIDCYNVDEETPEYYNIWIGYDGVAKVLQLLSLDSNGNYTYSSYELDITEILTNEIFVGFMGSMGDAENKSEISNWYFKNDLSLVDEKLVDADATLLTDDVLLFENSSLDNVTKNLNLPTFGQYGSTISWESSNTDVLATNGEVNTPTTEQGHKPVTLTATISNGSAEPIIKTFAVTIKVKDEDLAAADSDWLTDTLVLRENND
ncbi:MAG: immunoglobulin-like domain-containing protein, partial [Sedimentibacter sp.]